MNISLSVPSIACDVCAKTITKAIHNLDSTAEVSINVDTKMVEITSRKTLDELKSAIASAGHDVE